MSTVDDRKVALRLLPQTKRWRWITGVTVAALAYAALMLAYGIGTRDRNEVPAVGAPPAGGVAVGIEVRAVDSSTRSMTVVVRITPDQTLLDQSGLPLTPISVYLQPVRTSADLTWSSDRHIDPQQAVLELDGDIQNWPFDVYRPDLPVGAQAFTGEGGSVRELPTEIGVTGGVPGWHFEFTPNVVFPKQAADTVVRRTIAIIAFGLLLVIVLITLPVLALTVSISCIRGRRKLEPTYLSWIAAMLFATVPIRNFLPGNPPPGSWVDIGVVLWTVVGLAAALGLGVTAWWRRTGPGGPEPTGLPLSDR